MTSISEQLSAVRQSQWQAQLDIFHTLTSRALTSTEQLLDLNLRASRTSFEQVSGTFKQLLDATSPSELIAVGSRAQGQWHYLFSYGRELLGIASGVEVGNWGTRPGLQLVPAPTLNIPSTFEQVLDQASIATADAATVTSEFAAAAVDTGTAIAEATLHVVTHEEPAAAPAAEPAQQAKAHVEAEAEAAIDTAIADDTPSAAHTLVAAALNEIAPKPASVEHPIASTLPLDAADHVELPAVKPVEAAPPVHTPPPPQPKPARASRNRK